MKAFKPTESKEYPGYFISETFPEVAVDIAGRVLRLVDCVDKKNKIEGKRYGRKGDVSYGSKTTIRYRFVRTYSGEREQRQKVYVHRIAAFALLGPPPEGKPYVNHKDYVRDNNAEYNIEWSSVQENTLHGVSKNNPGLEDYPDYLNW